MKVTYTQTIMALDRHRQNDRRKLMGSGSQSRCFALTKLVMQDYEKAHLMLRIRFEGEGKAAPTNQAALLKLKQASQHLVDLEWMCLDKAEWPNGYCRTVRDNSPFQVVIGLSLMLHRLHCDRFEPKTSMADYMRTQTNYVFDNKNAMDNYILAHIALCMYIMNDFLAAEPTVALPPTYGFDAYKVVTSPLHESCKTMKDLADTWRFGREWESDYNEFTYLMPQPSVYDHLHQVGSPEEVLAYSVIAPEAVIQWNTDKGVTPMVIWREIMRFRLWTDNDTDL